MYRLYDVYDGEDFLGIAADYADAYNIFYQRIEDTDGECDFDFEPSNGEVDDELQTKILEAMDTAMSDYLDNNYEDEDEDYF